jgi:HlyD family secretion protein
MTPNEPPSALAANEATANAVMTGSPPKPTAKAKPSSEKEESNQGKGGGAPRPSPRRFMLPLILLSVAGFLIFNYYRTHPPEIKGELKVSGRIEGYETNVGAKIAGRVEMISNREGDVVKEGQLLVRLSDEDIQAQLRGANALWERAKESYNQAQDQISVVESQIDESKLNVQQSGEDAQGRIENAAASLAAANANLSSAEAQVVEAKSNLDLAKLRQVRYRNLARSGAVMKDQADQADTTRDTDEAILIARIAQVAAAKKQLAAAEGLLIQAKTARLNPHIRNAQLSALEQQLKQARSALIGSSHDIGNAKASADQIRANIAYLNIPSPINGIVTARSVEPGAVVAAGQTVIALINLDTVYLRAYVPEGSIGRVRVGQKATVYLDNDAKRGYEGTLIEIDPEASFTPENIYFKDDRVKQVFGIKIAMDHPGGYAKPGMPADAVIDTEGK